MITPTIISLRRRRTESGEELGIFSQTPTARYPKTDPLAALGHRAGMWMWSLLRHAVRVILEHALLLVEWDRLVDHTEGFRGSPQYQVWRRLLHSFYEPFPEVAHYEQVHSA